MLEVIHFSRELREPLVSIAGRNFLRFWTWIGLSLSIGASRSTFGLSYDDGIFMVRQEIRSRRQQIAARALSARRMLQEQRVDLVFDLDGMDDQGVVLAGLG